MLICILNSYVTIFIFLMRSSGSKFSRSSKTKMFCFLLLSFIYLQLHLCRQESKNVIDFYFFKFIKNEFFFVAGLKNTDPVN